MPVRSPAEIVSEIQDEYLYRDPPLTRPADLAPLLQELRKVTEEAQRVALAQGIPTHAQSAFITALNVWLEMLEYYEKQVGDADLDDREAVDRSVVDPLLRGYCWGPPSCTITMVPPLAISPRASEPFILFKMLEAVQEADAQNTFSRAVKEIAEERWQDAKKIAKEIAVRVIPSPSEIWKPVAVVAGVLIAIRLLRRSR